MATPATQRDRMTCAYPRLSIFRLTFTSIVTFLPVLCPPVLAAAAPHKAGLGAVLTTADGGEIFG